MPAVSPELKAVSRGVCRTKDGFTVLLSEKDAAGTDAREATLEEIMIHLEKEAEEG